MSKRGTLRILRSDLNDARNPTILERYPHLGTPENIRDLEERIERLERELRSEDEGLI